jgi:hypothetical protein
VLVGVAAHRRAHRVDRVGVADLPGDLGARPLERGQPLVEPAAGRRLYLAVRPRAAGVLHGHHQVERAVAVGAQRPDVVEEVVLDQGAMGDDQVGAHRCTLRAHR